MDPSLAWQMASRGSGPGRHWLLCLPPAFWARMHRHLDYADILNLSLLSTQFRDAQVESYLSWTVRYAVVAHRDREAVALISHKNQSQTCACYLCFRMKPIGEFQRPTDTYTCARVTQRDPYTGRRRFEPVTDPSPLDMGSIVQQPPSISSSPNALQVVGGGMDAVDPGAMAIGPASTALGPIGQVPALHVNTPHGPLVVVSRAMWVPQAPGAEPGQIERLRRYCIPCALEMHLLIPADVTTTQAGRRLWVCRCRQVHPETARRCDVCQMNQVFRD